MVITTRGKRHLGAALGSQDFVHEFMSAKVSRWCEEIESLAKIATSQPHAAFAAFVHGLQSKWSFFQRTIPDIQALLQPLEDAIRTKLIPAITGRPACSDMERLLLSLPARLGGLGILDPCDSDNYFDDSINVAAPLAALIVIQDLEKPLLSSNVQQNKFKIKRRRENESKTKAEELHHKLSPHQQRLMECAQEKGASTWVTGLPLDEHGFRLHKGAFRDALCLRYGWQIHNMPSECRCGASMSIDHALICHKGGFPSLRHNEIRDLSASLLKEVCLNTGTEPHLQPLNGETFSHATANSGDEARLDIRARGFWSVGQEAFFDVRVFHPSAPSYRSRSLSSLYRQHESNKKREYGQRVRDVEHGAFTPLVLSTTGGMARECTTFFRRLASMLDEKRRTPYYMVISWLRCKVSFALIRSCVMAICGSCSSKCNQHIPTDIEQATIDGALDI